MLPSGKTSPAISKSGRCLRAGAIRRPCRREDHGSMRSRVRARKMAPETLILPAGEAQRAGSNGRPSAPASGAVNGPGSVRGAGRSGPPSGWIFGAADDRQPDARICDLIPSFTGLVCPESRRRRGPLRTRLDEQELFLDAHAAHAHRRSMPEPAASLFGQPGLPGRSPPGPTAAGFPRLNNSRPGKPPGCIRQLPE